MTDLTFTTRAELEAWEATERAAAKIIAQALYDRLDLIRRVTLAHVHLKD
jgi:hypothetical protein